MSAGALEVAAGVRAGQAGKVRLVADHLCDGLGVCAKHCVQKALVLERREAAPFRGRFITDAEAARLAGGITAVRKQGYALAAAPATPSHVAAAKPTGPVDERGVLEDQLDADDIFHYRLGLCCRATECGRLCKRLVKQPGKAGVWCVDVESSTSTNLYQALAKSHFTCPDGVF